MRLRLRRLSLPEPAAAAAGRQALVAAPGGAALAPLPPGAPVPLPQPQLQPTTLSAAGEVHRPRAAWRVLWFVLLVLLPIGAAAGYLFGVAADQYVSEFRFTLNRIEPPRLDPLSLLAGNPTHSPAALESQVVVQYLSSRAVVDAIDPALDLRRLFAPPHADWWSRLDSPAPIEALVRYWRGQVDPFYDPANGTVVVRVRAFAAADAQRLAQAIVAASETQVNDLSQRARHDALGQAEAEAGHSEARLKTVFAAIRDFRDREGTIDPARSADAATLLDTRLRDDLLRAKAELATLRAYMKADAPAIKVLEARIRSLDAQRQVLARDLTDRDRSRSDTVSGRLGAYEQLDSERRFAEAAYQHALQGLDQARANADRQQLYIASFVPPMLAEEPLYPRRWRSLAVVALVAFALWGIGALIVQSIRDHF